MGIIPIGGLGAGPLAPQQENQDIPPQPGNMEIEEGFGLLDQALNNMEIEPEPVGIALGQMDVEPEQNDAGMEVEEEFGLIGQALGNMEIEPEPMDVEHEQNNMDIEHGPN